MVLTRLSALAILGLLTSSPTETSAHPHEAAAKGDYRTTFEYWPADQSRMTDAGKMRIESFLRENGSSSFLVIHKGRIAYEFGDIHKKHLIHSMRKPILSLLYGKAVEDGVVDLDEPVAGLGLEEPDTPFTDIEQTATLRQLLQSRSAIYLPAAAESEQMTSSRPERGSHSPGEAYYYNNWSFNSAGTLYEARTGRSIYDAFEQYLAEPLGMTGYAGATASFTIETGNDDAVKMDGLDGFYLTETGRSRHRAYHFRLTTHDLGLLGRMLANEGRWGGRQIVDEGWIDYATRCHSLLSPDIGGGRSLCYGLMWSVVQQDGEPAAFMHMGLGVHMIYVHPGADIVLVHRADTEREDYTPAASPSELIGLTFAAFE